MYFHLPGHASARVRSLRSPTNVIPIVKKSDGKQRISDVLTLSAWWHGSHRERLALASHGSHGTASLFGINHNPLVADRTIFPKSALLRENMVM
jgi:hypothetical protein